MSVLQPGTQSIAYDFISGTVQLPAGKTLKIETSPDGEELASYMAGRDCAVMVYLRFVEQEP